MREITAHKVNECNERLTITAGEPGCGGAAHSYLLAWPGAAVRLPFQDGPIQEAGTNGITHEALLAVVIDRLEGFQKGPFACLENGGALHHLRAAQGILLARTKARLARGVEDTHQP